MKFGNLTITCHRVVRGPTPTEHILSLTRYPGPNKGVFRFGIVDHMEQETNAAETKRLQADKL